MRLLVLSFCAVLSLPFGCRAGETTPPAPAQATSTQFFASGACKALREKMDTGTVLSAAEQDSFLRCINPDFPYRSEGDASSDVAPVIVPDVSTSPNVPDARVDVND